MGSQGESTEAGFTLIELMVVLLIIAILLAVAIPTFLGVTSQANDRAAQSNLANALTETSAQFQSTGQSYGNLGTVVLNASIPEFSWVGPGTSCVGATTNCISEEITNAATISDYQGLTLAVFSKGTSTCWYGVTLAVAPQTHTLDTEAFSAVVTPGAVGSTAGTFYSRQTVSAAHPTCQASNALGNWTWGTSIATAGAN